MGRLKLEVCRQPGMMKIIPETKEQETTIPMADTHKPRRQPNTSFTSVRPERATALSKRLNVYCRLTCLKHKRMLQDMPIDGGTSLSLASSLPPPASGGNFTAALGHGARGAGARVEDIS